MFESLRSVARFKPIELSATKRRLQRSANVDDLRQIARRRLPRGVFDYIDGAAEDEDAARRNVSAFQSIEFRPRVMRDMTDVDTSTELFGNRLAFPLVLAPTGFTRIAHSQGELAVARAAERAGIPYSLSTMATRSIEEVAEVNDGQKWFQVYMWRDRGLVKELVSRAAGAGYSTLMLTVDTVVLGRRERDVRRGYTLPPKLGLGTIIDGLVHPAWTWDFIRAEPITFANLAGRDVGDGSTAVSLAEQVSSQFDPGLSWDDVGWLRSQWDGPLVLKGIQTTEDALIAVDLGVDGIAISNHGGRQLDSAPAIADLIEPVVDAVGDRADVICDGGVRRGADIVKAVALGAKACMAGRAYLYGLGAAGEAGVDHVLGFLEAGVRRNMALVGVNSIEELSRDYVSRR